MRGASTLGAAGVAALAVVLAIGALQPRSPQAAPPASGDAALYARIVEDVRHGEPYHHAAVREQIAAGYPVRPATTVRMPTLAVALARVPPLLAATALVILAFAVMMAWAATITVTRGPVPGIVAVVLVRCGVVALARAPVAFHEPWAGLLAALSLAMPRRRDGGIRAGAWATALAAGLVRQTAAPLTLVLLMDAVLRRDRRDVAVGALCASALGAAFAAHAHAVAAALPPHAPAGQGWLEAPGLWFAATEGALLSGLAALPSPFGALVASACLAAWGACLASRGTWRTVAVWEIGVAAASAILGREDTGYWMALAAPLLPLGPLALWLVATERRDAGTGALCRTDPPS